MYTLERKTLKRSSLGIKGRVCALWGTLPLQIPERKKALYSIPLMSTNIGEPQSAKCVYPVSSGSTWRITTIYCYQILPLALEKSVCLADLNPSLLMNHLSVSKTPSDEMLVFSSFSFKRVGKPHTIKLYGRSISKV